MKHVLCSIVGRFLGKFITLLWVDLLAAYFSGPNQRCSWYMFKKRKEAWLATHFLPPVILPHLQMILEGTPTLCTISNVPRLVDPLIATDMCSTPLPICDNDPEVYDRGLAFTPTIRHTFRQHKTQIDFGHQSSLYQS